ncbi:hypothetical protein NE466_05915 [Veillonella parvula]|uniref:hypothetical protein n=1 Tax=Veillonella parvula TaxID=29466 RepID=UPI001D07BBFC|nr:hypothetical protein [Veillonella parvula]MCB6805101.1 hypothetical protein [Veillonella parvula]MCQ4927070.1 hypothetical protein [Veillonella parvula]MCQ4958259.1 hypothetical protein [Veillonella parvula]
MKKLIVITLGILTLGATVFANSSNDNSKIELSHYVANNTPEIQSSQNKTILSTLSLIDQERALSEYKKGKKHYYDLGSKAPGGLSALFKSPTLFVIATPYSLYRHEVYEEKQKFIPFTDEEREDLINRREVYIQTYSNPYMGIPTLIENMVIKKGDKVYPGRPVELNSNKYGQLLREGYSNIYAFDIDLFNGTDMDLIAINASNDNQITIHITAETYKKYQWY